MAKVVVLAPADGAPARWADELAQRDAFPQDEAYVSVGGNVEPDHALQQILAADVFIFFGHGRDDRLLAYSAAEGAGETWPALVDTANIEVLDRTIVYTTCCSALSVLGRNYGERNPTGAFIGYREEFNYLPSHVEEFGGPVLTAAEQIIHGTDPIEVVSQLRLSWLELADRLTGIAYQQLLGIDWQSDEYDNLFLSLVVPINFAEENAALVGIFP